jgi:hypothetical protein
MKTPSIRATRLSSFTTKKPESADALSGRADRNARLKAIAPQS